MLVKMDAANAGGGDNRLVNFYISSANGGAGGGKNAEWLLQSYKEPSNNYLVNGSTATVKFVFDDTTQITNINIYNMVTGWFPQFSPSAFTLSYSDDDSTYTDIDTYTLDKGTTTAVGDKQPFNISNSGYHKYYKIVLSGGGSYCGIHVLEFYGSIKK